LERMQSVVKDGRTVVFVSHHMDSVKSLCKSTVLLNRGEIVYAGSTQEAVERYLRIQDKGQVF